MRSEVCIANSHPEEEQRVNLKCFYKQRSGCGQRKDRPRCRVLLPGSQYGSLGLDCLVLQKPQKVIYFESGCTSNLSNFSSFAICGHSTCIEILPAPACLNRERTHELVPNRPRFVSDGTRRCDVHFGLSTILVGSSTILENKQKQTFFW